MDQVDQDGAAYPSWFGLRAGDRGTHTSRTIMIAELTTLLRELAPEATREQYRAAVLADNLLGKKTTANRKLTLQRLSELYSLDPSVPLFRVLRRLAGFDGSSNPGEPGFALLAFLCAYARDPLLRLTADAVLPLSVGHLVTTAEIDAAIERGAPGRLSPPIRNKVARNAGSSWTQAGLLVGRARKVRAHPTVTPSAVAYALLLGWVAGVSGRALFATEWTRILDQCEAELHESSARASHLGLIDLRRSGPLVEVRFTSLITRDEEERIHGAG